MLAKRCNLASPQRYVCVRVECLNTRRKNRQKKIVSVAKQTWGGMPVGCGGTPVQVVTELAAMMDEWMPSCAHSQQGAR